MKWTLYAFLKHILIFLIQLMMIICKFMDTTVTGDRHWSSDILKKISTDKIN